MISTHSLHHKRATRYTPQLFKEPYPAPGEQPRRELAGLLNSFSPIALADMNRASLLKREDTKFLLNQDVLLDILAGLQGTYRLFQHQGVRLQVYQTVYFDTPGNRFYHDHQRGAADRYKIRSREYITSHTSFLEVKHKTCHGETIKHRLATPWLVEEPSELNQDFLQKAYPDVPTPLVSTLRNQFQRVTLVNLTARERITVDLGLSFFQDGTEFPLPGIVIAEIKQPRRTRETEFWHRLKQRSIHPTSFSKYCVGMTMTRPWIKQNNFKPLLLHLRRLMQGEPYDVVL